MTDITTASLLIMTGICIFAAVHHAINAFDEHFSRLHFLFALVCAFLVSFELLHLYTYTASTLADYIPRLKWEHFFIEILFLVFPWFIAEYSQVRPVKLLLIFNTLFILFIVLNAFYPYSIQFSDIQRLEQLPLPWGGRIANPVGENTIFLFVAVATILSIFTYTIVALFMYYRQTRLPTALAMLLSICLLVICSLEGILVRLGVLEFIHLGPYGILAMVITMSFALSHELQHNLQRSEHRFRSLVEQAPFSIQVLSPDGHTLQVNPMWEKLWGVSPEQIRDYNLLQDQQLRDKGILPYIEKGFAGQATEVPAINYNPADNTEIKGPANERWVRAFIYPIKDRTGNVSEMVLFHEDVTDRKRFDDALHLIATGISSAVGAEFFQQLVMRLAECFSVQYAFIGVIAEDKADTIRTIAVQAHGQPVADIEYSLPGTPCANVIGMHTCVYPQGVQQQFPDDALLEKMAVESYVGTPLFDPHGKPLGIIVMLDDRPLQAAEQTKAIMEIFAVRVAAEIERNKTDELLRHQHAQLRTMVDQRTAELTTAMEELESFSYSVSHDLRAPLRAIDGFSQALAEDYLNQLDDSGQNFIKRIRSNAQRMALLIDDLLQLSRVTRKDINREQVNLSVLVQESLQRQQEREPQRKVVTHIAADITANADPDLLRVVTDNLMSNAWKYTGKTANAEIEFGIKQRQGKPTCYLKDNGVGFDMQYVEKIFGAFQRLHNSEQFEGSGIGLATVSRIIHRHGGEVWAEGSPDQGAVFYFTLPELSH